LIDLRDDGSDDGVDIDLLGCEEIEGAMKYLKNNKAAGANSFTAELMKGGPITLILGIKSVNFVIYFNSIN
jgi:hypothetical protein